MSRLTVALRKHLRPTWYRCKRAGYRAQIVGESLRRRLPRPFGSQATDELHAPRLAMSAEAWMATPAAAQAQQWVVDPPETLLRDKPPRTIEDQLHPHFGFDLEHQVAANRVLALPHGRVWTGSGAIVTADNVLLDDLSIAWQQEDKSKGQHPIFANWRYLPTQHIDGTVAALSTDGAELYYHWLFQLLPRIDLLERAGIDTQEIDYYLVNRKTRAYELDTLARLGIPAEKVLSSEDYPHLSARRLLAPSIPLHGSQFSPGLVRFARQRLAGLPSHPPSGGSRRLYLTRRGAGYRHLLNEAEALAVMESFGFEAIALEELCFDEQVRIMTEAEIVLGPHGGGMSNTVFCAPGTKVGEIFAESYVAPWFWFMANMTGVDYHYMIASERPALAAAERWDLGASMRVPLDKLERFVRSLVDSDPTS